MSRTLRSAAALSARDSAANARAFHAASAAPSTGTRASDGDGAGGAGLRSIQRHHSAKQTTAATFSAVSNQPLSASPAAGGAFALGSAAPVVEAPASTPMAVST